MAWSLSVFLVQVNSSDHAPESGRTRPTILKRKPTIAERKVAAMEQKASAMYMLAQKLCARNEDPDDPGIPQ